MKPRIKVKLQIITTALIVSMGAKATIWPGDLPDCLRRADGLVKKSRWQTDPDDSTVGLTPIRMAGKAIEDLGGKGKWLWAKDPFDKDKGTSFYQITKAPTQVDEESPVHLTRTKAGLILLHELIQEGTPVVLATLPRELVTAVPVNKSSEIGDKILKNGSAHTYALLLAAEADAPLVKYHQKGLQDSENPIFKASLLEDIQDLGFVMEGDIPKLFNAVSELRSKAAQEMLVNESVKNQDRVIDFGGNVLTADEDYRYFNQGFIRQAFVIHEGPTLSSLAQKAKAQGKTEEFRKFLKEWDNQTPGAKVTIQKMIPEIFGNKPEVEVVKTSPAELVSRRKFVPQGETAIWTSSNREHIIFDIQGFVTKGVDAGKYSVDNNGIKLSFHNGREVLEVLSGGNELRDSHGHTYRREVPIEETHAEPITSFILIPQGESSFFAPKSGPGIIFFANGKASIGSTEAHYTEKGSSITLYLGQDEMTFKKTGPNKMISPGGVVYKRG